MGNITCLHAYLFPEVRLCTYVCNTMSYSGYVHGIPPKTLSGFLETELYPMSLEICILSE